MLNLALLGRPPINWSNTLVCIDGNSIPAGSYHSGGRGGVNADLQTRAPITSGTTITNVAISGQTYAAMLANHSDVDAAFVAGKTNILVAWEVINSIWLGQAPAAAFADLVSYIAAVRAVNPTWKIVVVTGAYRFQAPNGGSGYTLLTCNQAIDALNALIVAGASTYGYKVADIRQAGSPFNFTDSTVVGNYAGSSLYSAGDGSDSNGVIYVHHSNAGFAYTLQTIATACAQYRR